MIVLYAVVAEAADVAPQDVAPQDVSAPTSARSLGLDEAVRTAKDNPRLREAAASTWQAQARSKQAFSALLPSVDGRFGYTLRTATELSGRVSASELVFDFGRTPWTWSASRADARAAEQDERDVQIAVTLGVRQAYFAAVAAKALVAVAEETVANEDKHLSQIQAFVEIGTRAPIDLATVRTDRANAEVALIRARGGYDQARAALVQAMGVDPFDFDVADEPFEAVDGEDGTTDALLDVALKDRPDAAALDERLRGQRASVKAAIGAYGPSLSVVGDVTSEGGYDTWTPGVGFDLSVPIFEGGALHAVASQERAGLAILDAQADELHQRIRLEIEQARVAVQTDKAAVAAADEAVAAAQEQLRLAEGRYETGVGNAIELSDAQLTLASAQANRVQAGYDLATARAQLLAALGR